MRDVKMEVARARVNADLLRNIFSLPSSVWGREVEVVVNDDEPKVSIVDRLYGIASNLNMTSEQVRGERLKKYENTD